MTKLPERLGTLLLVKQLGSGRHCQIWEVLEDSSQKRLAIKVVPPLMARDRQQRRLLSHESRVGRSTNHPNVIRIDRLDEAEGIPHLVMELFPHPTLKKRIFESHETVLAVAPRIAIEAATAIHHLHERGWVHRDIKPDNLLVTAEGAVKLIDLAIADRIPGLVGRLICPGIRVQGTPSYMSPEQIRGKRVDGRADIYSLGCMIFELLCGRPPFCGSSTNELLNNHLSQSIPVVDAVNRSVSRSMAVLVKQLLAKDPAQRPSSMKDVLCQLTAVRVFDKPFQKLE